MNDIRKILMLLAILFFTIISILSIVLYLKDNEIEVILIGLTAAVTTVISVLSLQKDKNNS
jgi:uncharacterized membrane protein